MKKNNLNINTVILSFGLLFLLLGLFGYDYICKILSMDVVYNYKLLSIILGSLMIMYYIDTYSKLDRVFRKTNLGIDGVYPIKRSKIKNYDSITYKFSLPVGLCTEDIKKKQMQIEEHLDRKIEISYEGNRTFKIKVFSLSGN